MKCFGRIKHSNTTKLQNDMQKIPYSPSSTTAKKARFWGAVLYRTTTWANTPEQGIPSKPKCLEFTHSLAEASTLQLPTASPHGVIWRTKKRVDKPLLNFQVKSSFHSAPLWRSGGATQSYESHEVQLSIIAHRGWHRKLPLNLTFHVSMDFAYGFMIIVVVPSGLVPSPASACQGQLYSQKLHSETHPLSAYVRLSLLPSTATANCRFLTLKS